MAAVPSTPSVALHLDDSLNSLGASPSLVKQDSPCGNGAHSSPRKRAQVKGKAPARDSLGSKDVNGGSDEGLLVDFGQPQTASRASDTAPWYLVELC